jgi:hypothetical protein
MGQQIAQEKGIIAWVIWAVCNTLTLALFGWLYNKKKISPETYNRKEVKVIALIIQLFSLLVQLNFINQQFLIITGSTIAAYLITIALGFFFTLIVYKKGLPTSVKTDVYQWIMAIVAIIAVIAVGIFTKAPLQVFAPTSMSGVLWGIWSGLILFGLYMLLILGMAFFKFTLPMHIILLVAVLGVTTSTIDSIAVALHEVGNKRIGTGLSLLLCIAFGVFVKMGMLKLWSSFGVIRFAFAVGILLLPLALKKKTNIVIPVSAITFGLMVLFATLGQITINSIVGVISFIIATLILGYVSLKSLNG